MATSSPFSFLESLAGQAAPLLQPVAQEMRRSLVLLLNHVLMQEPEARARLARQKGKVVSAQWRQFEMHLVATPAGLLDLSDPSAPRDLSLTVAETSPWDLAQAALRGDKPAVRIEGDVQLAAEVNWLVDHVRWDLEEDLARVLGDAPAHAIGQAVRQAVQVVRGFVARRGGASHEEGAGPSGGAR